MLNLPVSVVRWLEGSTPQGVCKGDCMPIGLNQIGSEVDNMLSIFPVVFCNRNASNPTLVSTQKTRFVEIIEVLAELAGLGPKMCNQYRGLFKIAQFHQSVSRIEKISVLKYWHFPGFTRDDFGKR